MINLIGSYDCSLDAKGRLPLPSAFKKQLGDYMNDSFVLKRSVFQPCLELYTMEEWKKITLELNKLNKFVSKNEYFIRVFTAGVKLIDFDSTGRLQISKDLIKFAKLNKNVVVTSLLNKIEIWDKNIYEEIININEADFASLAEDIMSKNGNDIS